MVDCAMGGRPNQRDDVLVPLLRSLLLDRLGVVSLATIACCRGDQSGGRGTGTCLWSHSKEVSNLHRTLSLFRNRVPTMTTVAGVPAVLGYVHV